VKKCKVYGTEKNAEADGIILDGLILLPAPRRKDIEPAHVIGGQCYYPPIYAVDFAADMHFDMMPFSTECEWDEYADCAEIVSAANNWYCWYGVSDIDFPEKWGYCDTKTGRIRIAPEMEYCEDFNEYGGAVFGMRNGGVCNIITKEGYIPESHYIYTKIKRSHHGVFVADTTCDGEGVLDSKGNHIIEPVRGKISWDGIGGYFIKDVTDYYIRNADDCVVIIQVSLTAYPNFTISLKKTGERICLGSHFEKERFRLTRKGYKYGLIRDVVERPNDPEYTYTEEILKPVYSIDEIPDAAYREWVDSEIRYYARLMERTPRDVPWRIGDGWDDVPEDIRENVQVYMMTQGLEQPETVDEI
jgi:hypothetical protein